MRPVILLSFFLCAIGFNAFALNMQVITTSSGGQYLIFKPTSYNGSSAYPMLVYLHGAQAIGNNIECSRGKGLPGAILRNNFFNDIPMIIIAPYFNNGGPCSQLSNNDLEWDSNFVNDIIDHAIDNNNIDEDRIFGSGISLGAKGLWDYVLAYPDRMAGIAPFSGNAPIDNICILDEVAVWAFHGEADGIIPPVGGDDRKGQATVVETINNCNDTPYLPAYLTMFAAKGHNGWDQTYDLSNGYNIYEWMLSLKKNVSTNYTPLVSIGPDRKYVSSSKPLTINGFAFDPNQDNLTYSWTLVEGTSTVQLLSTVQSAASDLTYSFTKPGTYGVGLTVTDTEGNSQSDQAQIEIVSSIGVEPAVTGLRLYEGNTDLGPISNNQVIDLELYDIEQLDIIAVTQNLNSRASIRFALNTDRNFISLNDNNITSNYSIGNNNHKSYQPSPGEQTIVATAYADRNAAEADQGVSYQINVIFSEGPLPVTLVNFGADQQGKSVNLSWTTAEEIQNSHFEIFEGRGTPKHMVKVAEIARTEQKQAFNYYNYEREDAPCGNLYYQLRSIDLDGTVDRSKIIHVRNDGANCGFSYYPNPVTGESFVLERASKNEPSELVIINATGTIVKEYMFDAHQDSRQQIKVDDLKSGIYIIQVINNGYIQTERLVIQH